jgi:3-hydroxyisobutyrate dehydrogenase
MSVLIEGAADTMALADRLGMGHPQLAEVIEGGPLDAPIADRRCQAPQDEPARLCAGVPAKVGAEDADLALRAAGGADLALLAALWRARSRIPPRSAAGALPDL